MAYSRLKGEQDHETKKKSHRSTSRKLKSQLQTPNALNANGGHVSDTNTINLGGISMLNISDASAFCIQEGNGGDGMRLSVAPSDLG